MEDKNLITRLGEAIDAYSRARRAYAIASPEGAPDVRRHTWAGWLLPTPGNVIFTLIVVAGLFWAQSAGALPLAAPIAASTGTIAYQGRLANTAGAPLTGTYNMTFRLYGAASGGAPLWEEPWNGANSVQVSDGLFNVMLGSLAAIPQNVVVANSSLFLGITVGTDSEMAPRVQLGSVPFAVQALTVPDGSITSEKLNLSDGLQLTGPLTVTDNIALQGVVTGPYSTWADYRSYIRFMKQAGATDAKLCPEGGSAVGLAGPMQSLTLKTGNDIAQARYPTPGVCVNVHQMAPCGTIIGDHYPYSAESCTTDFSGKWAPFFWWNGQPSHAATTELLGSGIGCFSLKYACVR